MAIHPNGERIGDASISHLRRDHHFRPDERIAANEVYVRHRINMHVHEFSKLHSSRKALECIFTARVWPASRPGRSPPHQSVCSARVCARIGRRVCRPQRNVFRTGPRTHLAVSRSRSSDGRISPLPCLDAPTVRVDERIACARILSRSTYRSAPRRVSGQSPDTGPSSQDC